MNKRDRIELAEVLKSAKASGNKFLVRESCFPEKADRLFLFSNDDALKRHVILDILYYPYCKVEVFNVSLLDDDIDKTAKSAKK